VAGSRETFEPHFWGNIEELKGKVLQCLDRGEDDFDAKKLTVDDVAAALAYLSRQGGGTNRCRAGGPAPRAPNAPSTTGRL